MKYAIAVAAIVGLVAAAPADADWEPVKVTTTTKAAETWEPVKVTSTTPAATWEPVKATTTPKAETWAPAPAPASKCSYTTTYVTKECAAGKTDSAWDPCSEVTKTSTVYPETCTWEAIKASTTPAAATWAPAPAPAKCTSTKVVTVTDYASKNAWETAKVVVSTETYTTDCATTWAAATTGTWAPAPVAPASTPVEAASSAWSTVSAPVAKWTGAADKQSFGMGAIAIAAVAALL